MELVNPVSAFQNSPQYFCDVNADKTKPTSENSEPIKSEALKLSDCVSVMASWWSCRMKKASEFIKSSATFIQLDSSDFEAE